MTLHRHVKIFRNGANQAVRIPREFEMPGDAVLMHKEGDRLVLEPVKPKSLLAVLAAWSPLSDGLPEIAELQQDLVDV